MYTHIYTYVYDKRTMANRMSHARERDARRGCAA